MKRIFTLFISSLVSLSLLAYDGSRLSISAVSNKMDMKVEIDGRRLTMQDNSITLGNMNDGYHSVKIYRESKKNNGWGFGRKNQEVLYNSSVYLRRGYHIDITVNRFGKVFTDERKIDFNDEWYDDDRNYNDRDGRNGRDDRNGGYNNGGYAMSNRDFDQAKETLRKDWFESSRINTAKLIIEGNYFTTAQVKELMQLFSFDDKKLDIAKTAYRKTIDKQNYYQLNEQLTFSGSKDELARFIRESR
jgi:Domain of unknown function (DUF4476)